MLKGVNKRVVEITATDHEYFEKAVLYVRAEKSGVPAEKINEEAREYIGKMIPQRKKFPLTLLIGLVIAAVILLAVLLVIYILM